MGVTVDSSEKNSSRGGGDPGSVRMTLRRDSWSLTYAVRSLDLGRWACSRSFRDKPGDVQRFTWTGRAKAELLELLDADELSRAYPAFFLRLRKAVAEIDDRRAA